MIDVYILLAISIALINFIKSIPACISPGKGKNGSTVAVSASFQLQFCAKNSFLFLKHLISCSLTYIVKFINLDN